MQEITTYIIGVAIAIIMGLWLRQLIVNISKSNDSGRCYGCPFIDSCVWRNKKE